MQQSTVAADAAATAHQLASALNGVVEWLEANPELPISYVHFADCEAAELCVSAGRFTSLTAAADASDALADPRIEVIDPDRRRITYITVTGRFNDTDISVRLSVYDDARTALLATLGAPPEPGARRWQVTADHLRAVTK